MGSCFHNTVILQHWDKSSVSPKKCMMLRWNRYGNRRLLTFAICISTKKTNTKRKENTKYKAIISPAPSTGEKWKFPPKLLRVWWKCKIHTRLFFLISKPTGSLDPGQHSSALHTQPDHSPGGYSTGMNCESFCCGSMSRYTVCLHLSSFASLHK